MGAGSPALEFASFICCSAALVAVKRNVVSPQMRRFTNMWERKKTTKKRESGQLCGTTANLNAGIHALRWHSRN